MSLAETDREVSSLVPVEPDAAYARPGFFPREIDRQLGVFPSDSELPVELLASGEPTKSIMLTGQGPNGMTLRGPEGRCC